MPSNKRKPVTLPEPVTGKRHKVRHVAEFGDATKDYYDQIYLGKSRVLADPGFLIKADTRGQGLAKELELSLNEMPGTDPTKHKHTAMTDDDIQTRFNLMNAVGVGTHTPHPLSVGPMSESMFLTVMQHDTHKVYEAFLRLNHQLTNYETIFQRKFVDAYRTSGPELLEEWLQSAWTAAREEYSDFPSQMWLRPRRIIKADDQPSEERTERWMTSSPPNNLPMDVMPPDPAGDMVNFVNLFDQDLLPESRIERRLAYDYSEGLADGPSQFSTMHVPLVPRYIHGLNYWNDLPWPYASEDHFAFEEPDGVVWNENFRGRLSHIRTSFLVPELNVTDMVNPDFLLSLVHHRGRFHPSHFAKADNDATYVGRQTRLLSGVFTGNFMISFSDQPQPLPTEAQFLLEMKDNEGNLKFDYHQRQSTNSFFQYHPTWLAAENSQMDAQQRQHFGRLRREGNVFAPAEAWFIVQRQLYMLLFLASFVEGILKKGEGPGCLADTADARHGCFLQAKRQLDVLQRQKYKGMKSKIPLSEAYLSQIPELSSFVTLLSTKSTQAAGVIKNLFNNGDYLYGAIKVQIDHHWTNLKTRDEKGDLDIFPHYGEYHEQGTRWSLYTDVLRAVLRRSVFEFFIWDTARHQLKTLEGHLEKYRPEALVTHWEIVNGQTPHVIAEPKQPPPEMYENCWELQRDIQLMVRYYAMFFWNEFRNKSIHACYSNVRDFFKIARADPTQRELPREHYGDNAKIVDLDEFEVVAPEAEADVHFAEVVNTFLGDRTASMHTGIRKVAGYLQTLVDKSKRKPCTSLVGETIDSLGLLATIADTLELQWPSMIDEGKKSAEQRENAFRATASPYSIDLLHFDDFPIEQYIEEKRLHRIYTWFDELQGFNEDPEAPLHLGRAKGACRRLGFSFMRKFLRPKNQQAEFQANNDALSRLEAAMDLEWSHEKLPYSIPKGTGSKWRGSKSSAPKNDEDTWNAEPNTNPPRMAKRSHDYQERLKESKERLKAYGKRRGENVGKKGGERKPWRKGKDISIKSFRKAHKRKLERREKESDNRVWRLQEYGVGELGSADIYGPLEEGPHNDDGWTKHTEEPHDEAGQTSQEPNEPEAPKTPMGQADENPQNPGTTVLVIRRGAEEQSTDDEPGGSLWDELAPDESKSEEWQPPPRPGSPWSEGWDLIWANFGKTPDGEALEYHRCLEWDIDPASGQYIDSHWDSVTGSQVASPYLDDPPSTQDVGDSEAYPLHLTAPDGHSKKVIKENSVWGTLETIFGVKRETNDGKQKAHVPVSWNDVIQALQALGYENNPRKASGSHWKFERKPRCRWPTTLRHPGRADISMHMPQRGGPASAQDRGTVSDFGKSLTEQGLSYWMIRRWYMPDNYPGQNDILVWWAPKELEE